MRRGRCRAGGAVAAVTAVVAAAGAGCGGSAGDLLALEVSGRLEPQPLRLTVTDDGRGRCGDEELEPISSERLIQARELERDLEGLAEDGASFGAGDGGRRYVARTRAGTVRWTERAPALPTVLPRAALLAERLQDDLCDRSAAAAQERTLPFVRARALARST